LPRVVLFAFQPPRKTSTIQTSEARQRAKGVKMQATRPALTMVMVALVAQEAGRGKLDFRKASQILE